jgi:hypothetical protein
VHACEGAIRVIQRYFECLAKHALCFVPSYLVRPFLVPAPVASAQSQKGNTKLPQEVCPGIHRSTGAFPARNFRSPRPSAFANRDRPPRLNLEQHLARPSSQCTETRHLFYDIVEPRTVCLSITRTRCVLAVDLYHSFWKQQRLDLHPFPPNKHTF